MAEGISMSCEQYARIRSSLFAPQTFEEIQDIRSEPCRLLRRSGRKPCPSRDSLVIVMESAEDRQGDDLPVDGALRRHRGLLAEPLVRACAVVVADVLGDDALEVPVVESRGRDRGTRDAANRETVHRPRSCPARAPPCG